MGRLAQGFGNHTKSRYDNIFFIKHNQVPAGSKTTYANPVCDLRPPKDYPYCVRLAVGGYSMPHPSDVGSSTASLLESKIIFSSVIFTPGSRFIYADIKDYFLCSHMERYEYIKIPFWWIPEVIHIQYKLYDPV